MIYQIENSRFLRFENPKSKGWASRVIDRHGHLLWLGGMQSAREEHLRANKIATVITVNEGVETNRVHVPEGTRQVIYIVKDNPAEYNFGRGSQLIE